MRLARFSIAGLMGLVLYAAVGMAALRYATEMWAGVLLALTLVTLGVATLGVIYRRGARRAFWLGGLIFGGGYLVLTSGPWFAAEVGPRLATTKGLDRLYERMNPARETAMLVASDPSGKVTIRAARVYLNLVATDRLQGQDARTAQAGWFSSTPNWAADAESFRRVGHLLLALLLTVCGGLVARWFEASRNSAGGTAC